MYIYKQNIDGAAQMDPPRKRGIPSFFGGFYGHIELDEVFSPKFLVKETVVKTFPDGLGVWRSTYPRCCADEEGWIHSGVRWHFFWVPNSEPYQTNPLIDAQNVHFSNICWPFSWFFMSQNPQCYPISATESPVQQNKLSGRYLASGGDRKTLYRGTVPFL